MMNFDAPRVYRTPSTARIESGASKLNALPQLLERLNARRIVLATSKSVIEKSPNVRRLQDILAAYDVELFPYCRQHSPESDIVRLEQSVQDSGAEAVVSIGGSSVFDTVKIALGKHANLTRSDPIPQIAIPTTLSAGEFTSGAGYTEEDTQTKKLVLDYRMAPVFVILDPEVTLDTPDELWLSSGVKALDHALEAVWAIRPHPYGDALALEAIRLLFENLPKCRGSGDLDARAACQIAAWMSITAAGAAGMRLSHFLGHQVGARMHIPHGVTSCILLPPVMRSLRDRTLDAQCRIAIAMGIDRDGLSPERLADAAADRLEALIIDLGLPNSIRAAGGDASDIDAITVASFAAAQLLGLADDLPDGPESIRRILLDA